MDVILNVPHFLPPLTLHASLITGLLWDGHSLQAAVIIIQDRGNGFHKLFSNSRAGSEVTLVKESLSPV